MSKILLSALFAASMAALSLSPAAFAADDQLQSDFHAAKDGCEACHQNETMSEDGMYENDKCVSCHKPLSEGDEIHKPHDNEIVCTDCHVQHEMKVGERPTCDECHDDGRTPESTLKK
ncbi:cytochrome c3 family protein [Shewanella sedimentimangrovi]|uniref:Cytochrome c3 family protein n=1 Tax=Shewanella sedimentimangrovi TaxID=2814293 RepID=A0ABX7QWH0_9GAMM|nr:cytochrome c3 family protein [Shewanella sedimentimangrovi]QSX35847.1 cytochrome c3 family protein [Shewanella sedimentimangrovi]